MNLKNDWEEIKKEIHELVRKNHHERIYLHEGSPFIRTILNTEGCLISEALKVLDKMVADSK